MTDKLIFAFLIHITTFALCESKGRQDKLDYTEHDFKNKNKYKTLETLPFLLWSFEAHMNTQSKSWFPGKGSSPRCLRNTSAPNDLCAYLHTPPSDQAKNHYISHQMNKCTSGFHSIRSTFTFLFKKNGIYLENANKAPLLCTYLAAGFSFSFQVDIIQSTKLLNKIF